MRPSTHDESKLPAWVQQRLALAAANEAWWRTKAERQQDGKTEVFYDLGVGMDSKQPLPPGCTVIVRSPQGEARMSARKGYIEVYTSGHSAGDMCLKPLASNHFLIQFHERTA
jgi:hypothetical protein